MLSLPPLLPYSVINWGYAGLLKRKNRQPNENSLSLPGHVNHQLPFAILYPLVVVVVGPIGSVHILN